MSFYNYDGLNWENPNADNWKYWAYLVEAFNERVSSNLIQSIYYSNVPIRINSVNLADIKRLSRSYYYRNLIIDNIINLGFLFLYKGKVLDESKYDKEHGIFQDFPNFTLDNMREKIQWSDLGKDITNWSLALKYAKKLIPLFRYQLGSWNKSQSANGISAFSGTNYQYIDSYTHNVYSSDINGVLANPLLEQSNAFINNFISRTCIWYIRYYNQNVDINGTIQTQKVNYNYFRYQGRFKAYIRNPLFAVDATAEYYIFPYPYCGRENYYKTDLYYFEPFKKDGKMIWKVGEKTIPKNTSVRFDYVGDYTAEPFTTPVKNTEFSEKPIRYQETQSILCGIYDFYHGFQLK